MSKNLFIVLGPQGSGKSTQAKIIAEHYRLPLFIAGEQCRKFAEGTSEEAKKFKLILDSGQLVPNEILFQLVERFIKENPDDNGLIIDGFPRSLDQCQFLTKLTKSNNWHVIGVNVDISNQTSIDRILLRAKNAIESGEKPRNDDKLETIKDRLEIFRQETKPVLDWLEDNYQLLNIDGEPNVESVTKEIFDRLPKNL